MPIQDDEVTFQDMANLEKARKRKGWGKISMACREALHQGCQYAWVDTCCIDKTNSAELSEAINSMYSWYQCADICFVYLADYALDRINLNEFAKCRWLTRGWTLQELIALGVICFYNAQWSTIGYKGEPTICGALSTLTSIPISVLRHGSRVSSYSAAQKMAWAAKRETTRIEDMAYCLMGLFDVNMPLLYGERYKAFARLQREILAATGDLTLLAWNPPDLGARDAGSFLATSPSQFVGLDWIKGATYPYKYPTSVTAWGIACNVVIAKYMEPPGKRYLCGLYVGKATLTEDHGGTRKKAVLVPLKMEGPNHYSRRGNNPLIVAEGDVVLDLLIKVSSDTTVYLHTSPAQSLVIAALRISLVTQLRVVQVFPEKFWDDESMLFYGDFDHPFRAIKLEVAVGEYETVLMLLLLSQHPHAFQSMEACRMVIFERDVFPELAEVIESSSHINPLFRGNFEERFPKTADLGTEWVIGGQVRCGVGIVTSELDGKEVSVVICDVDNDD